jgi:predicted regulator of amino acid metabolism with ACT domain
MERLEERIERAQRGGAEEIALLVHDPALEVLEALLRNPALGEANLLTLLARKNLPAELLEAVAKNDELLRSLRVKAAVARHPRTPRLAAMKLLKHLFLFDLVAVSLEPGVSAEIRRLAEEQIIARVEQVPLGERITLARRAPARVAAALLALGDEPVIVAALENPKMTEAALIGVLRQAELPESVIEGLARHPKWSLRYDLRLQLVRHPLTPLALALAFLPDLKPDDLMAIASDHRMTPTLRAYVKAEAERRLRRGAVNR